MDNCIQRVTINKIMKKNQTAKPNINCPTHKKNRLYKKYKSQQQQKQLKIKKFENPEDIHAIILQLKHNIRIQQQYSSVDNPRDKEQLTSACVLQGIHYELFLQFKVNRPRYYLVKPDRGLIQPNQTICIQIKLHKEGISEANSDKFKCFFVKANPQVTDRQMDKFQERSETQHRKLLVVVTNLPEGMQSMKNIHPPSQLKSLANTRSNMISSQRGSIQYEGTIQEKRERVACLTEQIDRIEKQNRIRSNKSMGGGKSKSGSWSSLIGLAVFGLIVGVLSSIWI